jgi:hypothetical protein
MIAVLGLAGRTHVTLKTPTSLVAEPADFRPQASEVGLRLFDPSRCCRSSSCAESPELVPWSPIMQPTRCLLKRSVWKGNVAFSSESESEPEAMACSPPSLPLTVRFRLFSSTRITDCVASRATHRPVRNEAPPRTYHRDPLPHLRQLPRSPQAPARPFEDRSDRIVPA